MNLLLAAATEPEITLTLARLHRQEACYNVTPCITGIGTGAASFALTRALCTGNYDFVLGAGIGGTFDRSLPLCRLVAITEERFADLGAEDQNNFHSVFDLGLVRPNIPPFAGEALPADFSGSPFSLSGLHTSAGITVETSTGSAETAAKREARFGSVVESMEGAALHYVCRQLDIPFLQLRAISNYAEVRNRDVWDIEGAVSALNGKLAEWLF